MLSSLRLAALFVFVAFPLLEIALLIKAGETIGFWATLGLLVAAAALGVAVIRARGMSMVGRMFASMGEGRLPFEPILDNYAVIAAGFLLIMPGFLSDVIALLLLVPPVRHALLRSTMSGLVDRRRTTRPASPRATVIEGTYERMDEDDADPRARR